MCSSLQQVMFRYNEVKCHGSRLPLEPTNHHSKVALKDNDYCLKRAKKGRTTFDPALLISLSFSITSDVTLPLLFSFLPSQ